MARSPINLLVGTNGSELQADGRVEEFNEGPTGPEARLRLARIREELGRGWLAERVQKAKEQDLPPENISLEDATLIRSIVESITSEIGRAMVGLCVLQLTIKAIEPAQSVRLHKGSPHSGTFSWVEGVPMRVLDKEFITPLLRQTGLLNLNADGVFMTRSLAENYPYSVVYKAAIRGAKVEWLRLIERLESGEVDAERALLLLLGMLWNRTLEFEAVSNKCLSEIGLATARFQAHEEIQKFIVNFISASKHSARLFEIALHSFFQVLHDEGSFGTLTLKPLSQMRSANKKHGNVGDIELISRSSGNSVDFKVIEAWDAKFNKSDLSAEMGEIGDKIRDHPELKRVGFVLSVDRSEITGTDATSSNPIEVEIVVFDELIQEYKGRSSKSSLELSRSWLTAFAETLCQKRRDIAPVDEPTFIWVQSLLETLREGQ